MKHIFVGVDGGGTNIRLIIVTEDGKDLLEASVRACGDIAVTPEATWNHFLIMFNKAAADIKETAGIDILDKNEYSLHIGLGIAGYSAVKSREKFIALLEQSNLFASYKMDNDVRAAYWDAHRGQPGGVIIIGTASIGIQFDGDKVISRFGGMGFPHDNKGSVAWMGLQIADDLLTRCGKLLKNVGSEVNLEEALAASEEKGDAFYSALLSMPNYYQATDYKKVYSMLPEMEIYQYIFANVRTPVLYARLGGFILDVLRDQKFLEDHPKRDQIYDHAQAYMKAAAREIDAIYAEIKREGVPIALYGGASKLISQYMGNDLQSSVNVINDKSAARGASFMIQRAHQNKTAVLIEAKAEPLTVVQSPAPVPVSVVPLQKPTTTQTPILPSEGRQKKQTGAYSYAMLSAGLGVFAGGMFLLSRYVSKENSAPSVGIRKK